MTLDEAIIINANQKASVADMALFFGDLLSNRDGYSDFFIKLKYIKQVQKLLDAEFSRDDYDITLIVSGINYLNFLIGGFKRPITPSNYPFYQLFEGSSGETYVTSISITWNSIVGGPKSTPSQIDNAVAKIAFTEDITVNFPNNDTGLPNGTIITAGTEIEPTFRQMLRKASPPTYIQPTVSLASSPSENEIEAGTIIDIILDSSFTQNDAGASSSVSIKKDGVEIATAEPYTDAGVQVTETPKVYTATYVYGAGPVKNDSLGNPDSTGQITAGSKTTNAKTYTGYRYGFVGFIDAVDSATVRAFTNKLLGIANGSVLLVTIPAGAERVVIAYPATLQNLSKVEYVEDSNKNITGNFTALANINIEGANAYSAIAYKRFEFIPVEPFPSAVTYRFTI